MILVRRWAFRFFMPQSDPANCIYSGHVMHMRLTPFAHRFRYRVFALLLDIDHLAETLSHLRLIALDRFGPLAFHRKDHGARDGSDLRPWVEEQLSAAGHPIPTRIRLLSFPRILGYVFNPLSVYYCEDADGRLTSVIYEVKNTFGDQHAYVVDGGADYHGTIRHQVDKGFYVSPFIAMDQTYRFTIRAPGKRLALKIRQHDGSGPWLIATQSGTRRPLTDAALAWQWASHPLMTFKVFAAIHWEALRLAIKGARFRPYEGPYPDPNAPPRTLLQRVKGMLGWKTGPVSD
ncbi:MAG: DUF1365 domain-containing protein [Paracoccaceae bacterium]